MTIMPPLPTSSIYQMNCRRGWRCPRYVRAVRRRGRWVLSPLHRGIVLFGAPRSRPAFQTQQLRSADSHSHRPVNSGFSSNGARRGLMRAASLGRAMVSLARAAPAHLARARSGATATTSSLTRASSHDGARPHAAWSLHRARARPSSPPVVARSSTTDSTSAIKGDRVISFCVRPQVSGGLDLHGKPPRPDLCFSE